MSDERLVRPLVSVALRIQAANLGEGLPVLVEQYDGFTFRFSAKGYSVKAVRLARSQLDASKLPIYYDVSCPELFGSDLDELLATIALLHFV